MTKFCKLRKGGKKAYSGNQFRSKKRIEKRSPSCPIKKRTKKKAPDIKKN